MDRLLPVAEALDKAAPSLASFLLGVIFIDVIYDQKALPSERRQAYYQTNSRAEGLPSYYLAALRIAGTGAVAGPLAAAALRAATGVYAGEGRKRGAAEALGVVMALIGVARYDALFVPNHVAVVAGGADGGAEGLERRLAKMAEGHRWIGGGLLALLASKVAASLL